MKGLGTASAIWAGGISLTAQCAQAQQQPTAAPSPWNGSHMMGSGAEWYGMVLGPLVMILILVVAMALAILLVKWVGGPWHGGHPHNVLPDRHPTDILRERYARGEISKEEFQESRRVLNE